MPDEKVRVGDFSLKFGGIPDAFLQPAKQIGHLGAPWYQLGAPEIQQGFNTKNYPKIPGYKLVGHSRIPYTEFSLFRDYIRSEMLST